MDNKNVDHNSECFGPVATKIVFSRSENWRI